MTIIVELTDSEIAVCRVIGNMRTIDSRATCLGDQKIGPQSGVNLDEDGVMAEYAFCKHWNIHMELDIKPRAGTYDCLLKNKRIDIKSTRIKTGHLAVKLAKNEDVDIFVLAIIDGKKKIGRAHV